MADAFIFHVDAPKVADPGLEVEIQSRLIRDLKSIAPRIRCAAVPNGGKRTVWQAQQAKKEGMSSGFPDLVVTWPGGCAFLEMKSKSTPLDDNQINWLNFLVQAGHHCGVFRSVVTAIEFLRAAGAPIMARAA